MDKPLSKRHLISETIRWKVVKMAHKLNDDMEVAKMLLDCYDAIISGCLQWKNDSKKKRLPYSTSEQGWKLLEEIMYMMEWQDRQKHKRILTMWIDDDDHDVQDQEDEIKVVEDREEMQVTVEEEFEDYSDEQKPLIKDDDDDDKTEKDGSDEDDEWRPDNQCAKETVKPVQNRSKPVQSLKSTEPKGYRIGKMSLIKVEDVNTEEKVQNENDDLRPDNQIAKDAVTKPVQKRSISTVPRLKKEKTRYAPKGYSKQGRSTKAIEILNTPTQTKVIECKRCLDRFTTVGEFMKHYPSHTEAVIIGKQVKKVPDLKIDEIPYIAAILIPCKDCNELTDNLEVHQLNKHFRRLSRFVVISLQVLAAGVAI
ncbi:uncharacterized protein [Amphiura filiformis]|uniref:uncharacterized protein isoform X2 n=1 Tax=Amphiura filiformis TaxID=82378 RepID=UPI003B20B9EC